MLRLIPCSTLLLLAFGATGIGAAVPCFAPSGDWITGSDLAAAAPALAAWPAALKVGYAPVPGLERVFHPDELRRLALGNGLPDPKLTGNLCSAWPVTPLLPAQIVAAMEKALAGRSPQIELVKGCGEIDPIPAGQYFHRISDRSTPHKWSQSAHKTAKAWL